MPSDTNSLDILGRESLYKTSRMWSLFMWSPTDQKRPKIQENREAWVSLASKPHGCHPIGCFVFFILYLQQREVKISYSWQEGTDNQKLWSSVISLVRYWWAQSSYSKIIWKLGHSSTYHHARNTFPIFSNDQSVPFFLLHRMLSVDRQIVIFQLEVEILAFCLQVESGIVWHFL